MKNKHFFILPFLLIAFLFIIHSCSKSSDSTPATNPGTTSDISIVGMSYSPASKTVAKGSVVKWTNTDGTAHTVTSDDGSSFNSSNISAGSTYLYTASVAGTFNYHCTIHGVTMAGTLIVTP